MHDMAPTGAQFDTNFLWVLVRESLEGFRESLRHAFLQSGFMVELLFWSIILSIILSKVQLLLHAVVLAYLNIGILSCAS